VIAAYGEHVVMKETLADALSALFVENKTTAATETPGEASAARPARDALDHYDRAMERLKSGDWAGFGKEIDAMRGFPRATGQPLRRKRIVPLKGWN